MAYTGNVPATQYTSTVKDTFNGDGTTTDFTLSRPSLVNNLEVFVENVQQEPTTAYTVSGTTLSFTSAPVSGTGNVYVIHRGQAVQTIVPPAGISLNATDASITNGLTVDKNGATVATFDRATSDGTIIDLQKDGTTVGSIGNSGANLYIEGNTSGKSGLEFEGTAIVPRDSGSLSDGVNNLGSSANRFKDLYLSGGVYLGGTGSANKLDDYEEGTWTPTVDAGTITTDQSYYTKIGRLVTVVLSVTSASDDTSSTVFSISGLPFTPTNGLFHTGSVYGERVDASLQHIIAYVHGGQQKMQFIDGVGTTDFANSLRHADINAGSDFALRCSVTYQTDA
jgi:hypothetical protein